MSKKGASPTKESLAKFNAEIADLNHEDANSEDDTKKDIRSQVEVQSDAGSTMKDEKIYTHEEVRTLLNQVAAGVQKSNASSVAESFNSKVTSIDFNESISNLGESITESHLGMLLY